MPEKAEREEEERGATERPLGAISGHFGARRARFRGNFKRRRGQKALQKLQLECEELESQDAASQAKLKAEAAARKKQDRSEMSVRRPFWELKRS